MDYVVEVTPGQQGEGKGKEEGRMKTMQGDVLLHQPLLHIKLYNRWQSLGKETT